MTRALLKNTFREIAHTKARFIAIMAIITLGVGFFAGIKATAPSMVNLAERYYREKRLMDFRLVSTVGFAEEDIRAVAAMEGVQSVMPSYFCDVMTSAEDGGDVVRLIAVPKSYEKNRTLNTITVNEGRSVRRSGEIVTESVAFANARHKVGATITFAPFAGENELKDLLKTDTFTVVGKAESPLYISYQRGVTNVGDGKIDEYMYISADDFQIPRYTELYIRADFSDKLSAFSDKYAQKAAAMRRRLEQLAGEREQAFVTEVIPNAKKELASAQGKYDAEKAKAEKKLGDALALIEKGEKEYKTKISEAEGKLREAKEKIDSGETALASGESDFAEGIAVAQGLLAEGAAQVAAGQAQLDASGQALAATLDETDDSTARTTADAIGSAQLGAGRAQLFAGSAQVAVGGSELAVQRVNGQLGLQAARSQLAAAKTQYESGMKELETQKKSGDEKLAAAREEYNAAKAKADKELAAAQTKLRDGEAALAKLAEMQSEWYVFDRDDNPGFNSYDQNADRLDAVASVFPLFFLLVAVLVCVTTMTRLIEEKRTEIATLKALGYGSGAIVLKYVIYSLIAAVAGSAIGVLIGVNTLPYIIYDAYKIMFYIGEIDLVLHVPSIVLGVLAAVLCTTAVSVIVCARSLRISPAQAMRPKAPKPGKRILLEYITPLWRHMGFTVKLTARNLFRYKVRMCMTVIGVAGCTALIVAAFGLLDSFVPLTSVQFGEIYRYDVAVIPRKSGSPEQLRYLKDLAAGTGRASASMLTLHEEATVTFGGRHTTESTYLTVPETAAVPDDLITLRTRKDKTPLRLDDETALLNEKLASDFGVRVGDTIRISTDSGEAEIKVSGIYEHYIYNYVFISPACYQRLFGKAPAYNVFDVRLTDRAEETGNAFSKAMLADSRVTAVSFMDQNVDDFRKMLNSLDMVVVVMVVCAAALAFVVLYNLTNINIAERRREIATFKVLGFYNRETSRFIYIENIILTLLGIAAGLGLGVLLTGFIIRTVEVDNVMFGRDIYPLSYLLAAGMTMLFSLLVNAVMSYKIRSVNMVESLKSIE